MSEDRREEQDAVAQRPERDVVYIPRADIRETTEHFEVVADMPGVNEKTVEATVQNRVLTIEGWTCPEKPEGYEPLGQEFGCGRYRRDFTLPESVDVNGIQARVKQGVLSVRIPKKEEVKARKIEVSG
jgi:HSP20 family molecular chaperone IbpA